MTSVFPLITDVAEGIVGVKRPQTRRGAAQRNRVAKVTGESIMEETIITSKRVCVEGWLCEGGERRQE